MSHMPTSPTSTVRCILQCGKPCSDIDSIDNIGNAKWKQLKDKSLNWKDLDRFGHVYDDTNWENGPKGLYMHQTCYLRLSGQRSLLQSQKRKIKDDLSQNLAESDIDEKFTPEPEYPQETPFKHWCFAR